MFVYLSDIGSVSLICCTNNQNIFHNFFKAIESLTQKLHEIEREKESQKCHIQTLQGKVLH